MLKHILVPTDGSGCAATAIEYAIALAKRYGAKLHGLHVIDVKLLEGPLLHDLSASLGTAPFVNYQNNITMLLDDRGRAALAAFEQACRDAQVEHDATLVTGGVARSIVEKSELADLVIMGRSGEHAQWLEQVTGTTTEAVIRRIARPVLVTATSTLGQDRFVVAYDGSHYARHALQFAARIGVDWKMKGHVLAVGGEEVQEALDEARAYLGAHDVPIEYVRREGDPSETIVHYAQEVQADLLVMGAYGHSKVRELVVGSTTAYAMYHAPCPLLLTR